MWELVSSWVVCRLCLTRSPRPRWENTQVVITSERVGPFLLDRILPGILSVDRSWSPAGFKEAHLWAGQITPHQTVCSARPSLGTHRQSLGIHQTEERPLFVIQTVHCGFMAEHILAGVMIQLHHLFAERRHILRRWWLKCAWQYNGQNDLVDIYVLGLFILLYYKTNTVRWQEISRKEPPVCFRPWNTGAQINK